MGLFDQDKWQEIFFALKKNKLRTFFTAFGVFWGIFMLILMLGSGKGLRNGATKGMGDMATNAMFVWTQQTTIPYKGFPRGRRYNFDNDDTRALLDNIAEIEYLAPRLQVFGGQNNNNVVRGERTAAFSIQGDYPAYNLIDPANIEQGRFINYPDIKNKRKNIVIGTRVYNEMFEKDEDPIGENIRIQGVYFKVVGVLSSKKNGREAEKENSQIVMPFTTMQHTYNFGNAVGWYSITAKKGYKASVVLSEVKELLKGRHSIAPADDRAVGSFNLEEEFRKMTSLFVGIDALVWIVGIGTLLAGVIGVSNIMLIVVKERTKEIGIQRALGATPYQIKSQIVIEAVFLTTLAGYVGLVLGVGMLELIDTILVQSGTSGDMFSHPEVDFNKAVSALILLVLAGALAGLIPAQRAVQLKPIDALRDE
ncbi:MAG: ABC transporter permease [Bacteroidales bacterium]|nr:ABC transporter permease [Bacteroidales bacterium]